MSFPERIVKAEYHQIEGSMSGPGTAVHHRHILPIREGVGGVHHLRITPGVVGGAGIDIINQRQPARAAELDRFGVALAIDRDLLAPPTELCRRGVRVLINSSRVIPS